MAGESDWHNKVTEHGVKIANLKEEEERQWVVIEKIRNRLPNWATFAFAFLTCLVGTAIGLLTKG